MKNTRTLFGLSRKRGQNGGQLNIVMEHSRTLIITFCWSKHESCKRNVSRSNNVSQRILHSFDLQFGFSAFYPKNKVNIRISGIVLDSAIQDDCKYVQYIHTYYIHTYSRCHIKLPFAQHILKQAWESKCQGLRTREISCLCDYHQNEKFPKSLNYQIAVYRKLISQSTESDRELSEKTV